MNLKRPCAKARIRHPFIQLLQQLNFSCQIAGIPEDFDAIRKKLFDHERLQSINE